jgi:hypothetical protein
LAEYLPLEMKSTGLIFTAKELLRKRHSIKLSQQGKVTNAANLLTSYYTPQTERTIYRIFEDDFELGHHSNDPLSVGLT